MSDAFTLRIRFDGSAPGLSSHRLSIAAFGVALGKLVDAYRRIASGVVNDALGTITYGARGGQYAKLAKQLDLEIERIGGGCVELAIVGTQEPIPGATYDLFDGLATRSGKILLDAIEAESKGEWRNQMVRNYLEALPQGLTEQRYALSRGKTELASVVITKMDVAHLPKASPFLDAIEGRIVGVGFAPGPSEIRVKSDAGVATFASTPEQVARALLLRETTIKALVVKGVPTHRLVWIRRNDDAHHPPTHEQLAQYASERWDGVLRRLAQ